MQDFCLSHIHINMKYLISSFACVLYADKIYTIQPNCKYCIERGDNTQYLVVGCNGESPFVFNFCTGQNVMKIEYNADEYYYLYGLTNNTFVTTIKFNTHTVNLTINNKLYITIGGEKVCDEICDNIEYSHYEIRKNTLVIFFKGKRDYVVILRDKELMCASHYDEINMIDGELVFMCRCRDSLNHGKVFSLNKNNEYDSYLVYLNDNAVQTKDEFVPLVFLDAVRVGNYKYANKLLDDSIRLEDDKKLSDFFEDYDDYLVLDRAYALIKKNTLVGIYQFEISNSKIINIIRH